MIIQLCLKTVGKTVDSQIEEIGTNDPIFAIIVNMLQTKLSEGGSVEIDAKTVANNTNYSIDGERISIGYDFKTISDEFSNSIQKELRKISGRYYTVESISGVKNSNL